MEAKVKTISDFKNLAKNFAHFQRRGDKGNKFRRYIRQNAFNNFLTFNLKDNHVNVVFYAPTICGDFELKTERMEIEKAVLDRFINFEADNWFHIPRSDGLEENDEICTEQNFMYVIQKIGKIELEENPSDEEIRLQTGEMNPVRVLLRRLYSEEKSHCGQLYVPPVLKYPGFFITLFIAFICVAFASNVQQASVRLIVAMYSVFQKQQIFYESFHCTDTFGRKVITSTLERINLVKNTEFNSTDLFVREIVGNISRSLESKLVCNIARDYGKESFMKTLVSFVVIWVILQVFYILTYEFFSLKKIKKANSTYYKKALTMEILGGFVPMFTSGIVGCLFQYFHPRPTICYVFFTCVTAVCTRIAMVMGLVAYPACSRFLFDCNFRLCRYKLCKRLKYVILAVSSIFALALQFIYPSIIYFHYTEYNDYIL